MQKRCFLTQKQCISNPKKTANEHTVFLGYQFKSNYCRQVDLLSCIQLAVNIANQDLNKDGLKLSFKRVGSNEGLHISCEICEQISDASICIFEISDKNPNVLFELGLAAGKEIILLKHINSPDVPSDLSGIKYVNYHDEDSLEGLEILLAKRMYDSIKQIKLQIK